MTTRTDPPRHRPLRPLLVAVLVFVMTGFASAALIAGMEEHRRHDERTRVFQLATDYANDLQRRLDRAFSVTYALAAMVRQGQGEIDDFEGVATEMLSFYPGVAALELAPGGVIREVVPLATNERILGHDILGDPDRFSEASVAFETRELTLSGPFELIQGGIGATARLPVFLPDEAGDPAFWGFTIALIRFPQALEGTLISQLPDRGLAYHLWRTHPDSGEKQLIAASSSSPLNASVDCPVRVPNNTWTLSVAPVSGWGNPAGVLLPGTLGLLFSLLLAWLSKLLMQTKTHETELEALVEARTEEIRATAERLRRLEDNLPDSYTFQYFHDDDGFPRFLYLSAGVEKVHGIERQEVLKDGTLLYGQVDPEQLSALQAAEGDSRERMTDFHMELRIAGADGRWRWLQIRSRPRKKKDGRIVWDGVATDISGRKEVEAALRTEREGLMLARFAIDRAGIGIFRLEEDGRISDINEQYSRALGYSREELCALSVFDIDPEMTPHWWDLLWRELLQTKGPNSAESRHRRRDGSIFPVEVTANCLEHEGKTFVFVFARDITERKRHEEQLRHLATHDDLTGLANRALLLERLEQSLQYARRSGRMVAVLLLDLDRFKVINDSLGHAFGDKLLCTVAQRLREGVREADTVARLGGDEFVIILGELNDSEDVRLIAAKVLEGLAEPLGIDDREILLTASLGISLFPADSDQGAVLLRNADMAMYRAKNDRSTFAFYSPEMNRRILETLELENALRKALENGEFCLHYQPKVDLASGAIVGCEALVRWRHPQRGMIWPDDFIALSEETGLIVPLGIWVLKEACRQAREWSDKGLRLSVAVNLSAYQLRRGNLPCLMDDILKEARLDPKLLELELTESMVMDDPQEAQKTLSALKRLGVSLSLDDFGTGYSSLNYLRKFPVDTLKIDRSFIREVPTDSSVASVVSSVIAIAKNLGLKAVAEGVETEEQLTFLADAGCDMYQGFFFSRPVAVEEFEALCASSLRVGAEPL